MLKSSSASKAPKIPVSKLSPWWVYLKAKSISLLPFFLKLHSCSTTSPAHIGIDNETYQLYTFGEACKISKEKITWIKVFFEKDELQVHAILSDEFDSYCLSSYLDLLLRIYKKKFYS